jgi:hypothetical protein
VSRAIARALARSEGAHISIRGEAQCGIAAVEIACVAGVYDKVGPVLLCSPYTLSRIVTAAAWYTTEHAADPGEDYESFRLRHPSHLGLASLQASKSLDEGRSQTTAIEALRKESEQAESGEAPTAASSIFEAILTLTFAAIIGHESSHLETVPPFCAVEQRSRLEENGTWDVLLRVEMSGELFQAGSPVREEVVADRCAMRRIRLARSAIDSGPLDERNKEFSRRAAADIISTLLFFRLAPEDSSPVVTLGGSYLYPSLRIAALAGELGSGGSGPAICGGAAENLVQSTQIGMQRQPGNGLMPDEMESLFPRGVVDAWERREPWSTKSINCAH